jgi:hypothetical protein
MRSLVLVGGLALVLVVAATPAEFGSTTPRAAILYQAKLFRQGKFRLKYETTYTANFRARCPWSRYVADQRYGRRILGPDFTLTNIRVRMLSPTRALLAYRYTSGDGRNVVAITFRDRDLYVKIGRFWYDEYDRVSRC